MAARRDGFEWVINGSKIFITNGKRADFCLLVARTDKPEGLAGSVPGPSGTDRDYTSPEWKNYEWFSLFLVDTDLPGLHVSRTLESWGCAHRTPRRSSSTACGSPTRPSWERRDRASPRSCGSSRVKGSSGARGPSPALSTPWQQRDYARAAPSPIWNAPASRR
jgi:hypothetical protein